MSFAENREQGESTKADSAARSSLPAGIHAHSPMPRVNDKTPLAGRGNKRPELLARARPMKNDILLVLAIYTGVFTILVLIEVVLSLEYPL